MNKAARKIFSRLLVWFILYSILYGLLSIFNATAGWHFWIRSAEIVGAILLLLIFIPAAIQVYTAILTSIPIDDND